MMSFFQPKDANDDLGYMIQSGFFRQNFNQKISQLNNINEPNMLSMLYENGVREIEKMIPNLEAIINKLSQSDMNKNSNMISMAKTELTSQQNFLAEMRSRLHDLNHQIKGNYMDYLDESEKQQLNIESKKFG